MRQQDCNAYHRNVVIMTFDILLDRFVGRSKIPASMFSFLSDRGSPVQNICYHSTTEA